MANLKELDLSRLHSNVEEVIEIEEEVNIDPEIIENSDILELKDVKIVGKIEKNLEEEIQISGKVEGTMILEDSISLEKVDYPFSFEIDQNLDENVKKDENTLDLIELLWENIVLEIPLKFTKVTDLSKFHGDGWKLIREDEVQKVEENPFSELLKDFGEE